MTQTVQRHGEFPRACRSRIGATSSAGGRIGPYARRNAGTQLCSLAPESDALFPFHHVRVWLLGGMGRLAVRHPVAGIFASSENGTRRAYWPRYGGRRLARRSSGSNAACLTAL